MKLTKEKLPSGSLVLPKAQYSSQTTGQAVMENICSYQ